MLLDGVGKSTHFDLDLRSVGRGTVAEARCADVTPAHPGQGVVHVLFGMMKILDGLASRK